MPQKIQRLRVGMLDRLRHIDNNEATVVVSTNDEIRKCQVTLIRLTPLQNVVFTEISVHQAGFIVEIAQNVHALVIKFPRFGFRKHGIF